MRIAILGLGNVGAQLARLWSAAGHTVSAGLRQGSKHEETAKKLNVKVLAPAAAIEAAEVVALALPWSAVESALQSLGSLQGKIMLDATNPLKPDLSVIVPPAGSGAQQVAAWAPGSLVVKAFNTIGAAYFGIAEFDGFYCGDDAQAKEVVRSLIADTTMKPVDLGPLKNATFLEHMAGLWVDLAVNKRVTGPFGFNLIGKS